MLPHICSLLFNILPREAQTHTNMHVHIEDILLRKLVAHMGSKIQQGQVQGLHQVASSLYVHVMAVILVYLWDFLTMGACVSLTLCLQL